MSQQVSIEILEPRGVLEDSKREGLTAPRLDTLAGKTIAMMGINIPYFFSTSVPFFKALDNTELGSYTPMYQPKDGNLQAFPAYKFTDPFVEVKK